jgi:hypothetical protein
MSRGYIYLFFGNDAAPELGSFEKLLAAIGLRLRNPASQKIFTLSSMGSQRPVTHQWIVAQLAEEREVSIQWWYSGAEDIYCRFRPRASARQWRVEFGLDGVDDDKVESLIRKVLDFFKEHCVRGDVAALVVDRTGDFEETDWDGVVEGREILRVIPDILVIPRTVVAASGVTTTWEELIGCPLYFRLSASESR